MESITIGFRKHGSRTLKLSCLGPSLVAGTSVNDQLVGVGEPSASVDHNNVPVETMFL